jgi:hypothetical protein
VRRSVAAPHGRTRPWSVLMEQDGDHLCCDPYPHSSRRRFCQRHWIEPQCLAQKAGGTGAELANVRNVLYRDLEYQQTIIIKHSRSKTEHERIPCQPSGTRSRTKSGSALLYTTSDCHMTYVSRTLRCVYHVEYLHESV